MKILYSRRCYNNIKMDFIRIGYEGAYWFRSTQNMVQCPVLVNREINDFEVLRAVVVKSVKLWDIMPCNSLNVKPCFGGTCRLHLQVEEAEICCIMLVPGLSYSSDLEVGGDMFLRKFGRLSKNYTALYPRTTAVRTLNPTTRIACLTVCYRYN
jgi:hypothetical protein